MTKVNLALAIFSWLSTNNKKSQSHDLTLPDFFSKKVKSNDFRNKSVFRPFLFSCIIKSFKFFTSFYFKSNTSYSIFQNRWLKTACFKNQICTPLYYVVRSVPKVKKSSQVKVITLTFTDLFKKKVKSHDYRNKSACSILLGTPLYLAFTLYFQFGSEDILFCFV